MPKGSILLRARGRNVRAGPTGGGPSVGGDGPMIAAAVQGNVDGIPEGPHS
jgi:hypothetical protein